MTPARVTGEAFLAALIANPGDRGTLGPYADWLEENGDPVQAAFIRKRMEDPPQPQKEHSWDRVSGNIADMQGLTIAKINRKNDELTFTDITGKCFRFYHDQDCCESVSIEDVAGDLNDLIGNPLTMAEWETSDKNPEGVVREWQDSFTWTFYRFATVKGYVTVRWYGESNGYYSETVDLEVYTR